MKRTYGKVWFKDNEWRLQGEAHLILRVKRVFGRVPQNAQGVLWWRNTPETCADLRWFMQRYPMTISDKDAALLKDGAEEHEDTILRLDDIIDRKYKPGEFEMALPPRDYQKLAAALTYERGFLLLADDLGTGKTVSALSLLTQQGTLPAVVVTLSGTMPRQWQEMCWRFLPRMTTHVVSKGTPYELPKIGGRGPDAVVLNYHKLHGWSQVLASYARTVIFDEAQELRRQGSQKYEAAKFLARRMAFRLSLSATPIFNLGGEIWSVVDVLKEDVLGTREEFEREWCGQRVYGDRAPQVKDPKALGTYLRAEHIMLRRTRKELGRELPALTKIPQYVESDEGALDSIKESAKELAKIILSNEKVAGWDRLKAQEEFSQVLRQATGVAKCLAPGSRVMKADGSVEVVGNLKKGDLLLGPDSKPRRIMDTVNGYGEMYEISSTSRQPLFEPYTVNGDHVLALKHSGKIRHGDRYLFGKYLRGDHVEIPVSEYLTKSKHFKRMLKGYKSGVEFEERELPLDPYFLGLWLGDGNSDCAAVTTAEREIVEYLLRVADQYALKLRVKNKTRTAPTYFLGRTRGDYIERIHGSGGGVRNTRAHNPMNKLLKDLNVLGNKHIPHCYLISSRLQRMRLLAGLIDSDGHHNRSGVYTIATRWPHLAREICRLAWSLGLAGKTTKTIAKNQTGKGFPAYIVRVYGNGLEDLPLLVPRKKSAPRRQIKDPLRSGIAIKPVGMGSYCGFALDGDGLFLLNDFTVTHNSPYVADFIRLLVEADDEPVIVFAWHREVYTILQAKLADLQPVMFTGSETPSQKTESMKRFMEGKTKVLLMSLRAGQGLDGLQKVCRTVVFAELDWSPAVHDQCVGRIQRDGQDEPVTAFYLVTERGSDPVIAETLGLKTEQAEGIRDPHRDIIEELQTDPDRIRKLAERYLQKAKPKETASV